MVEQDSLVIGSTIIDGNNNGSVVLFNNGESHSAVLRGFTLQGGNGNYADPDENGTFYTYGGGIYCKGSSPILKDLVVTNNTGVRAAVAVSFATRHLRLSQVVLLRIIQRMMLEVDYTRETNLAQ